MSDPDNESHLSWQVLSNTEVDIELKYIDNSTYKEVEFVLYQHQVGEVS